MGASPAAMHLNMREERRRERVRTTAWATPGPDLSMDHEEDARLERPMLMSRHQWEEREAVLQVETPG